MRHLVLAWGLTGCGALGCGVIGLERRIGADAGDADRCVETSAVDWASSPMPTDPRDGLPNPARRTVAAGGATVRDEVTGLIWQREPGPRMPWADAAPYCAALELAGCDAWRLPARIELATLVDHTTYDPAIDLMTFPGTDTTAEWWSMTLSSPPSVWVVNFLNGNSFTKDQAQLGNVRCVRAGGDGAPAPQRYQVGATVVADLETGLTWQRLVTPVQVTLAEAEGQCAARGLDGGGWRLPAIGELHSLSTLDGAAAKIDPVAFPDTPPGETWSSTRIQDADSPVMVVDFDDANVYNYQPADPAYARCVR